MNHLSQLFWKTKQLVSLLNVMLLYVSIDHILINLVAVTQQFFKSLGVREVFVSLSLLHKSYKNHHCHITIESSLKQKPKFPFSLHS